jgi:carbon storage regulator
MLMISRRVGETIVIGDDIEVTVTEISRKSVRLAVKAHTGHQILRGEIRDSIATANREAATSNVNDAELVELLGLHDASPRSPPLPASSSGPLDGRPTVKP